MERMLSGIMNLISRKRWYDVRAQNAVRRYCHLRNPSDIIDTILSIKMDIPCSGILKGKYLEGVIRLVYIEKLDESQFETINDILSIIKDSFVLQKRYDGDFNGLYYEDLCFRLDDGIKRILAEERRLSAIQIYQPNKEYSVHRIHSFEDAMEYAGLASWCISESRCDFENYTQYGGTFYVCLKHGYQDVVKERGEGHPLDEYGLSMIAISVRRNGRLATCTTRWNEASGNGRILKTQQIGQLIGRDFYSVFIPG